MCNCLTMCRIPDIETDNGRWPMPRHSPACEDYKPERFVRVAHGGSGCVMEPDGVADMIADGGEEYETEDVFLTRDQYDALPEFDGF